MQSEVTIVIDHTRTSCGFVQTAIAKMKDSLMSNQNPQGLASFDFMQLAKLELFETFGAWAMVHLFL